MPPFSRRLVLLATLAGLAVVATAFPGGAAVGIAAAPAATAETTALRPVSDAHVQASHPRRSFGRQGALRLDRAPVARAYLWFGNGVQRAATVRRASLRLYALRGAPAGFHVRTTHALWSERSLTYTNAPRPSRVGVASGPVRRGWVRVDVTSVVRRYGAQTTFVLTTASRAGLQISSRESRRRPQLILTTDGGAPPPPPPPPSPPGSPPAPPAPPPPSPPPPAPPPPPPGGAVVLAGAGDIAYGGSEDEQTAKVLDALNPDVVYTLGDNAYDSGSASEFASWYAPTWGRHKVKTRPAPGNHDYRSGAASGYFGYFGAAAGEPDKGYYSYSAGSWQVLVLNTNGEGACAKVACNAGSAQERWLRAELAASSAPCTLAYMHHPRFSIGQHGANAGVQALWQALYEAGADVVLAGHDHNYQRWAPLNGAGSPDPASGLRSFVVGTGGKNAYSLGSSAHVEAKQTGTPGVLKLTLRSGGYDWEFVPVAGKTYTDSGSGSCHAAPGAAASGIFELFSTALTLDPHRHH